MIGWSDQLLEILRSCLWTILPLSMLYWLSPTRRSAASAAVIALGMAVAAVTLVFNSLPGEVDSGLIRLLTIVGHLLLALVGIAMIENLFRNSPSSRYWTIKHLCLGLGAIFIYDFFLYSDALLFRRLNVDLFLARGAVNLLAVPLLITYAARGHQEGPAIAVSRRTALHSATLVAAGFYLLMMAAAGYYVQRFGGTWSNFLQAVLLFGATLLFLASIFSGSFRARLRILIEKNLFRYKYDYRAEWLRFIRTTSESDRGDDLSARVIQAVCDIMDSSEGALWLAREPHHFTLVASRNISRWDLAEAESAVETASSFCRFLESTQWIVIVDEFASTPARYPGLDRLPSFVERISRIWLIVPLIRQERLFGFIIVGRPRAERALTWEDFDLLKTVGRQAASYLAEEEAGRALAQARQFEEFNKRFAFVAHDIKSLVSQLSLIVKNADRHRDNEAFRRDADETLRESVDKLNRMLRQLHSQPADEPQRKPITLAPLLGDIVAKHSQVQQTISLDVRADKLSVAADEERLRAIVEHLVQNALDAVGKEGSVQVRLTNQGKMAVIEIEDNGPGMEPAFIREKLFRPFASTKDSGYGIGVFESRDYATSLGGRLEVESEPGKGTVMRMAIPIVGLS